jgi:hypothetical protein
MQADSASLIVGFELHLPPFLYPPCQVSALIRGCGPSITSTDLNELYLEGRPRNSIASIQFLERMDISSD